MKTIVDVKDAFVVGSCDNLSWAAVYASDKTVVEKCPINGWALVGVVKPGSRHPIPEIHGIFWVIDNQYSLAGWERKFLGYCRHEDDAEKLYGKAARALLKKLGRQAKPAKGARP